MMTTARVQASFPPAKPRTTLSIIDAKDLRQSATLVIVNRIFNHSFAGDSLRRAVRTPDTFIRESYFEKNSIEAPCAGHILLAKLNNEICGFIITTNYKASYIPAETAEVA